MLQLNNIEQTALDRYFKHLENYGYIKDNKVKSLIVLLFLEECLTDYFTEYITEADYNLIRRTIENLSDNNCLIDDYKYFVNDNIIHETTFFPSIRLDMFGYIRSDGKSLRITEDAS